MGCGGGGASGRGRAVVRRAARSRRRVDLPRPLSPSRMVSLPRGMRPGQSQRTGRGVMAERVRRRMGQESGGCGVAESRVMGSGVCMAPSRECGLGRRRVGRRRGLYG